MPLLIGVTMFIVMAPTQVSAAEQTWITWGTPAATWTGNDTDGADLYEADQPVALTDGSAVITYSVNGAQSYGHVKLQDASGGEVEGAAVNEPDATARTATITGLSPETTYRLHWVASESNGRLSKDVYLTFTTGAGADTTVTEPVQTWITFNTPEVQWIEFKNDADWYQAPNKLAFDSEGKIIFTYNVNGAQRYGHVKLQDASGGEVEGAAVDEPDATARTATITGLKQNTSYRLFWSAEESNGKLTNDVYLTFKTEGPNQNWITWGTPAATWTGNDTDGADLYEADQPVALTDGSAVITYSVNGAQRYGHVKLQDASGGEVEGAAVNEPDGRDRIATITGLSTETTYRLHWVASESNGKLSKDVYLTFTTGAVDSDDLMVTGVKEEYEYTGSEIEPAFTVKVGNNTLTEGTDYDVSYEGDRVNAGGTVTMTVTGKEGTPYEGKSKSKEFKITKAQITAECIALPKGAGTAADGTVQYAYSGSEIKPAPVVTVNGRKLVRETDYILNYTEDADFVKVAAGKVLTVSVTAVPGSNYNGGATVKYTIIPKAVTPAVKLASTSYTYSGKAIYPSVTVKTGTKTLAKGTDYTASYTTTHKTVGKHGVKVTLKGNYKGTKTVSFKILPKKAVVAKATPGKKKLTVKLKTKVSTTGGKTYQIAYRVKGAENFNIFFCRSRS